MWINKNMGVVQRKAVAYMERTLRDHLFCKSKETKAHVCMSVFHASADCIYVVHGKNWGDNAAVSDGFIRFAHFSLLSVSRF